ncbi:hypothetical protein OKA05_05670 [Luteolibacter arcticus]|uniref:Uncharacterized protein n=1 Tax=Luteolibacter arcticus TaxID=1581411 RepID=A0ABT3GEI6_9BACT|nr:hypothetical protein [Luteolibacter arcticus]MCW1922031.1 hypothetical protein [Luteolibacter arcticus]
MLRSCLILLLLVPLPAFAEVDFVADFEAGSQWFTEPWSAAARTEMEAFLEDVGPLFDSEATVRVRITDDEDVAYASAFSTWHERIPHETTGGEIFAPAPWMIMVKGVHKPAMTSDVTLNWNLNVAALYAGNSADLIANIRGLGRHEMHHAFGASTTLYLESGVYDPRGKLINASLMDTLVRDQDGNTLLGTYNVVSGAYLVKSFTLAGDWQLAPYLTGLYFQARDRQGRMVPMAPISGSNYIDFSHIKGISYVNDHPTWSTYVDTDLNFLRALGYPLAIDSPLLQQTVPVTGYTFTANQASLTFNTVIGRHYRLATSTDLSHWSVLPVGKPGTGASVGLTSPINRSTDPRRFFQVVEIAE